MKKPELLLSWVDVARWIWKASQQAKDDEATLPPPDTLVYAQTFWDRLLLGVAPDTNDEEITDWLATFFGPRWNKENNTILLEGIGDDLSFLPVELEELSEEEVQEWHETPFQARFSPPKTVIFSKTCQQAPKAIPLDHPPVLAFHSFKGGVGRTLSALAMTQAYTKAKKKVLLVDADFEAPGISFLFKKRKVDTDFSLADLLTMLHADPDPEGKNALASAKAGVVKQQLGSVFILPCFRDLEDSISLEIRPEHLVASTAHPPFFLTDILSRLGKALRVDIVIIDLRAGLSELSAPLLLDPRVKLLLVANVAGQSIHGTRFLIQQVGQTLKANQWSDYTLPALILNQVPASLMPKKGEAISNERVQDILEGINILLKESFPTDLVAKENGTQAPIELSRTEQGIDHVLLSYNEPLALLSDDWESVMETIQKSVVPDQLWENLQIWLPTTNTSSREKMNLDVDRGAKQIDDERKKLRDFSDKLVNADKDKSSDSYQEVDFLPIQPLDLLAQDHVAKIPIVVSIGAKGAGKTYSFLNLARSKLWTNFVKKVDENLDCNVKSPVLPVLWSKNADWGEMNGFQKECRKQLYIQRMENETLFDLPKMISTFQKHDLDLYAWRDFWVNAIAQTLGFHGDGQEPIDTLLTHLRQNNHSTVAIIDGLEEAFPEFATDKKQQLALRSLLQEVPNWLRTLPGLPLGIIIFVRQDMVLHAIPQNRTQFTDRFQSYALRWSWNEALELAAWVCKKSGASPEIWSPEFSKLTEAEQAKKLMPLWGYKLGGDNTNEARSNNWVLSVLSDLRGRVQARDVVRFMSLAAKESVGNTKTMDRLLAPAAMRQAIQTCSQKKVDEIEEENAPLKEVFEKIKGRDIMTGLLFSSPCTYEELSALNLNKENIELMEENGIIFFDSNEKKYHFPEIFRHGLGIERAVGARPMVVSLIRRARNQGRF